MPNMIEVTYAPTAFRLLNGVFCVIKESGFNRKHLQENIAKSLASDLNLFEQRPIRERVVIEGNPITDPELKVVKKISYADHPLVVGPRYQPQDFDLLCANRVGFRSCGLIVIGIGEDGVRYAQMLKESNFVKTYEIKCKFGRATDTFFTSGLTREKTTFHRLSYGRFRSLIGRTVSSHRPMVYKAMGIDTMSQDGYELASAGLVRPISEKTVPLLLNLKCTHFDPPDFTLEMQTANEDEKLIGTLVHGLGIQSRTTAAICSLNCIRYGYFTNEKALLPKQWTVEHVINNITAHQHLLAPDKISPSSPILQKLDVATAARESHPMLDSGVAEHRLLTDRPVSLAPSLLDE